MINDFLRAPLTVLSGIGEVRAAAFARLGVTDLGSLLGHYPRNYQDRGDVRPLSGGDLSRDCSYLLTVTTEPQLRRLRGKLNMLRFRATDDTGVCEITYFNQPYYKNQIKVGARFRFYGRLGAERGTYKLNSPKIEAVVPGRPLPDLLPVYPLAAGLNQRMVREAVAAALVRAGRELTDFLPEELRRQEGLSTLLFALRGVHCPADREELSRAVRRLRFDEFFLFALTLRLTRGARRQGAVPRLPDTDLAPFLAALPFAPTGAQARAIREIAADLSGGSGPTTRPMSRIVSGDVGSGKTAVAAAAAYLAMKNGRQAALMAPTEILASQHFAELSPLFAGLGFRSALLTGSTRAAEKKQIYAALSDGTLDFVVGTHALLQKDVAFSRAALFITDEQHRFGVLQRAALNEKSADAHVLVMSATPIPRTLALAMYGDLDLSVLDELPPGRQRVDTFVVDESYRARLDAFIRRQADEGHQTYIVCPAVEENPDEDTEEPGAPVTAAAVEYAGHLAERLPGLTVACMHGRLPAAEKDAVMAAFAAGRTDVLVSTTVIEVGVNVPNATLMIVENAERFGLSQLHQLRGRVGRGSARAYCVLVSPAASGRSRERLEILRTTYDGYKIAERDLALRGPGDFFPVTGGARQHGELSFRLAGSMADEGELKRIFSAADALLAADPGLADPDHALLRAQVAVLARGAAGTLN